VHEPPIVPHAVGVCDSHTLPLQHPVGHDAALQTHWPPTHAWPPPHARPDPHEHEPPLQPSDTAVEHCMHWAPPEPHSDAVTDVTQVVPLQQPVGHESALHTHEPLEHSCPATHAAPAPH
jgi:hypothetical protein